MNFAGKDFHLSPLSPALDIGTAMEAPARDLEGTPRPLGKAFDVGAYESCGGPCASDGGVDLARAPVPLPARLAALLLACVLRRRSRAGRRGGRRGRY